MSLKNNELRQITKDSKGFTLDRNGTKTNINGTLEMIKLKAICFVEKPRPSKEKELSFTIYDQDK